MNAQEISRLSSIGLEDEIERMVDNLNLNFELSSGSTANSTKDLNLMESQLNIQEHFMSIFIMDVRSKTVILLRLLQVDFVLI